MASYETYLGVGIDASGALAGANQFAGATNKVASAAEKAAQANARMQQQIDNAAFAIKAFATATAALAIREIGGYTQAMSNARAMTQGNEEDMKRLSVVVRELGASTVFSATQVADAAATLGQAGFAMDKIMGTLPAVLDLAAAASVDMATAADITAGAMASFGLNASQATHATDVLAAVATGVKTDIRGLGEALKAIGPSAQQVGWTLEDTSAILGVMAQKNLEGSMSGTALKAAIGSLVAPSRMAKNEIKNLKMGIDELNPNMVGGIDLFKNLAKSTIDAEGVFRIFGREAANGVFAVISSIRELDRVKGVIDNATGSTKKMAEIKLDNLWGDFEQLTGALSELALKVGDTGIEGSMRKLIKTVTSVVDWFSTLAKGIMENKDQLAFYQEVALAVSLTAAGMVAIELALWFYGAATAIAAATTAAGTFYAALLLIGGGSVGAIAYLISLGVETQNLEEYTQKQNDVLLDMGGAYGDAARSGEIALTKLQLASMRTAQQIQSDIDSLVQAAELRDKMQNSRFPGGKPAGFSDPGTATQIAGQTDTELISQAVAELKKRETAEKKINDLLEKQEYLTATTNRETRQRLKFAEDFSQSFFMNPLSAKKGATFGDQTVKSVDRGTEKDKKDPFMLGELKNVQLALELAKNLGAAESELYRIRLNSQALEEAKENGQKAVSAITQKQIEQAVALKAEEDKLTTVYEARKGLADNLKGRLKTANEALMMAQNMGKSESDLLRTQIEAQAAEYARKMGLQGINAEMQFMINKIISLTSLAAEYKKAFENDKAKKDYLQGLKDQLAEEQKRADLMKQYKGNIAEVDTQMKIYNETKQKKVDLTTEEIKQAATIVNEEKKVAAQTAATAEAAKKAAESQKQWNNQLTSAFKDAIMNSKNLGDALSNLANRVQDMLVNKALDSLLGGMFASMKFAKGAAFSAGGVTAFASGGVVNSPTMFPMRGGVGLMGEAGAEAIMPLTRTSNGDLGVKAVGAGTVVNTSININVSGGTKEQNEDAGKRVSAAVRQAIDDTVVTVIMREKRPGGVLNAA